jgi:hypothetical protein
MRGEKRMQQEAARFKQGEAGLHSISAPSQVLFIQKLSRGLYFSLDNYTLDILSKKARQAGRQADLVRSLLRLTC